MKISVNNTIIEFKEIPLEFNQRDISSVFFEKNNKTLAETLQHQRYQRLKPLIENKYVNHLDWKLGDFLKELKKSNDNNYLLFLNKYGDNKFCEFKIANNLNDKGIYCYVVGEEINYIGRCTDNFKKRVNQGYGKIHPKNCFIDGQATNCHLNSLINNNKDIRFGVYVMNNATKEEISKLERELIQQLRVENSALWNIQLY